MNTHPILYLAELLSIFDIESLIRYGGLLFVVFVVYVSTGLFFCFFLPSGAVIFTGGVFVATGVLPYGIASVCSLLIMASVLGNITGYWFGRQAGPGLYRRKDSRFFRHQYLKAAEEFSAKYGDFALTIAFFLPVVRSFAPVVAGMIRMNFRRFLIPSVAGSMAFIGSFIGAGYFIGSRPSLKPYLNYIVIGIIICVTIPIVMKVVKGFGSWRKKENDRAEGK